MQIVYLTRRVQNNLYHNYNVIRMSKNPHTIETRLSQMCEILEIVLDEMVLDDFCDIIRNQSEDRKNFKTAKEFCEATFKELQMYHGEITPQF